MPTLLSEKVITLEFSDLMRRVPVERPSQPLHRAPGAHQSEILQYIAHKIGVLKPGERDEEEYPLIWALGAAVEEFLVSFFPDMIWQPGEVTRDEISVNSDGLTLDGWEHESQLEEFKGTYKRVKSGEEFLEDWMYMHQGRSYCYCYDQEVVRWHVFYVRGDYKKFGPMLKQYIVRFTQQECRQTWQMLLNNKEDAMREKDLALLAAIESKLTGIERG